MKPGDIAFCPNCGAKVYDVSHFCHKCGANLQEHIPGEDDKVSTSTPADTTEENQEKITPSNLEKGEPDIIDLSSLDAIARREKGDDDEDRGELTRSEESPSTGRFQICPMCGAEFFLEASLLENLPLMVKCRDCEHEVKVWK